MPLPQQFTKLTAVVGIASSVGCASLGHGPSPVPLQGSQAHQVGAQFDAPILLSLPEGTSLLDYGFGSTLWYRQKVGTDLELIVESGANISGAILPFGNVAVRKYLRDQEGPVSVAVEGSIGLLSVDVGLPVALRLGSRPIWLTSHPSVGYFYWGWAYVPVGIAARPLDTLELSVTAGSFLFSQDRSFVFPTAQFAASYSW